MRGLNPTVIAKKQTLVIAKTVVLFISHEIANEIIGLLGNAVLRKY